MGTDSGIGNRAAVLSLWKLLLLPGKDRNLFEQALVSSWLGMYPGSEGIPCGEAIYSNLENKQPSQYLDGIQHTLPMRREFVQGALMLLPKSVGIMSWTGHPAPGTGNVPASLGNVSQLCRNCPYSDPSF